MIWIEKCLPVVCLLPESKCCNLQIYQRLKIIDKILNWFLLELFWFLIQRESEDFLNDDFNEWMIPFDYVFDIQAATTTSVRIHSILFAKHQMTTRHLKVPNKDCYRNIKSFCSVRSILKGHIILAEFLMTQMRSIFFTKFFSSTKKMALVWNLFTKLKRSSPQAAMVNIEFIVNVQVLLLIFQTYTDGQSSLYIFIYTFKHQAKRIATSFKEKMKMRADNFS